MEGFIRVDRFAGGNAYHLAILPTGRRHETPADPTSTEGILCDPPTVCIRPAWPC